MIIYFVEIIKINLTVSRRNNLKKQSDKSDILYIIYLTIKIALEYGIEFFNQ